MRQVEVILFVLTVVFSLAFGMKAFFELNDGRVAIVVSQLVK